MSRTTPLACEHGKNFTVAHFGPFAELMQYVYTHPKSGRDVPGKLFVRDALALTGMEMSLNSVPVGTSLPFLHCHREHEEVYVVLSGSGQWLVDGQVLPVGEGSIIRIAPAGERTFRNTGQQPLVFLVIQVEANSLRVGGIEDGFMVDHPPVWPEVTPPKSQ